MERCLTILKKKIRYEDRNEEEKQMDK